MKALILAAGRGSRLGDKTNTTNKCMFTFNGKPILEYNLQRAADISTITEIVIVVGYQKWNIIDIYNTNFKGKKIRYVIQKNQRGVVHAIECAKNVLANEDFFLMLGDEILINSRHIEMTRKFIKSNIFGLCGTVTRKNHEKQKISKTYAIIYDCSNIVRFIEKPKWYSFNSLQGTGHCILKNEILSYIDECPIHIRRGRDEKELPDLFQCAVDDGKVFTHFNIADNYFNVNYEEDLREINENKKDITIS